MNDTKTPPVQKRLQPQAHDASARLQSNITCPRASLLRNVAIPLRRFPEGYISPFPNTLSGSSQLQRHTPESPLCLFHPHSSSKPNAKETQESKGPHSLFTEGEGFEPPGLSPNCFQDSRNRPLCHPSDMTIPYP